MYKVKKQIKGREERLSSLTKLPRSPPLLSVSESGG